MKFNLKLMLTIIVIGIVSSFIAHWMYDKMVGAKP